MKIVKTKLRKEWKKNVFHSKAANATFCCEWANAKTNKRKAVFCELLKNACSHFLPFFQWDSLNLLYECSVIFCGVRRNRENSTQKTCTSTRVRRSTWELFHCKHLDQPDFFLPLSPSISPSPSLSLFLFCFNRDVISNLLSRRSSWNIFILFASHLVYVKKSSRNQRHTESEGKKEINYKRMKCFFHLTKTHHVAGSKWKISCLIIVAFNLMK